jgi:hypothetical protein
MFDPSSVPVLRLVPLKYRASRYSCKNTIVKIPAACTLVHLKQNYSSFQICQIFEAKALSFFVHLKSTHHMSNLVQHGNWEITVSTSKKLLGFIVSLKILPFSLHATFTAIDEIFRQL